MTISRDDLRQFVKLCNPDPLPGDDPRYVPLDKVRGQQAASCIDMLQQNVDLRDQSCQLFSGFLGTGKTTELRKLQKRLLDLKDLPTDVIYVDFDEYIDRYSPLAITDILRVLAHCLDREATVAEGADPDKKPGYIKRLYEFVAKTDVKLKDLDFSAYGVQFMLELKNDREFYRRIEAALAGRFQQFAAEAQQSITTSVARLKKAKGTYAQRMVVVADSLEKLTPLREEDRESMEASVEDVYLTHATLLRLPCHVIYTFPLWLRYRRADLGERYDGEPLILPMVKVTERNGELFHPGIDALVEMMRRRVDIQRVFGTDLKPTLHRLILASGGYPRDLLRMVRNVLTMPNRPFPVDQAGIEEVVARLSEDYSRALFATDLDALVKVALTHSIPRDSRERLSTFARLIEHYFVLAYRNGAEWYDLHPMVRQDPMVAKELGTLQPQITNQT